MGLNGYATKVVLIEPITTSDSLNIKLNGKLILNNRTIPFEISSEEKIYRELVEIFEKFEKCTYRLSLYYKWDPIKQTHISAITRMNGEWKELLYVHCSNEYRKLLEFFQQINNIQEIETMDKQLGITFFIEQKPVVEAVTVSSNLNSGRIKTAWLIGSGVIIICICLIIIFKYIIFDDKLMNGESAVSTSVFAQNEKKVINNESVMPVTVTEPINYYKVEEPVIYSLPEGMVALTFDDGPSKYTEEIVNILLEYEVGATFFFVGSRVQYYPQSIEYVRDHQMGVANHSWSHTNFFKLTEEQRLNEVNSTNEALDLLENESVLFRPPYGLYDENMINQLNESKSFKFVLWNRDPRDWNAKSQEEIIDYFQKTDPSGAIYILHENEYTVSALPKIIELIKQHEVEFVIIK